MVVPAEVRIGAGGWSYFKVPGEDSLEAYSKAFDFVELNSTFYEYPKLSSVESWRRKVPENFEFSVRCHRDLTHKFRLEDKEESHECLEKMGKVCGVLSAKILHLQVPRFLEFDESKAKSLKSLLLSSSWRGTRIALEWRGKGPLPEALSQAMADLGIIHCTDLSKEEPTVTSDILYTRLFGKGEANRYQFDDEELMVIDSKSKERDFSRALFTFHGVRMYKDAARFLTFKRTGRFPKATKFTGLKSLEEILKEDARFPSTKEELIRNQGWKVVDLTEENRVHASELLKRLPESKFKGIDEVVQLLKESYS